MPHSTNVSEKEVQIKGRSMEVEFICVATQVLDGLHGDEGKISEAEEPCWAPRIPSQSDLLLKSVDEETTKTLW